MSAQLTISNDTDKQLELLQETRYDVINELKKDKDLISKDKDLRRDLRGFLKDADSQLLTKKRIASDDENSKADQNLKEAYMALLIRNGGQLPTAIDGDIVKPALPSIDDFEFDIPESEIKIGNDIDVD